MIARNMMMDMNMQMCRRPSVIYAAKTDAAKETTEETPVGRAFTETEIQMTEVHQTLTWRGGGLTKRIFRNRAFYWSNTRRPNRL